MNKLNSESDFLPISIRISGKKILLIGGGKVALEKITSLQRYTSGITILSKKYHPDIENSSYQKIKKSYEKSDIKGYFLVYACTNSQHINQRINEDCHSLGILVNVVDNPVECDFVSPAIHKMDNISIAVSSDGKAVRKSIAIRNKIRQII